MPLNVTMSIGPPGQPPSTSYTHEDGAVTLSARPQTTRSPTEVSGVVASIDMFLRVAASGGPPPATPPGQPHQYRLDAQGPNAIGCRFRCPATAGNLTVDATIDLQAKTVTFEARPEKTIAWSDFESFASWMRQVLAYAYRSG